MNKYRKAESRRIKAYVRTLRALGYNPSYRRARRRIRKINRAMRDFPKNFRRGLHKGIKRCDYHVSAAVRSFAGLRTSVSFVDEMHDFTRGEKTDE